MHMYYSVQSCLSYSLNKSLKMSENSDWKVKVDSIVTDFFKSRKNSNCLLELEELFLSPDEECVLAIFKVVLEVFSKLFTMGMLNSSAGDGKESSYNTWLQQRYEDFISHLLIYLSHDNTDIQTTALQTLMSFVKLEAEFQRKSENNTNFPFVLFKRIIHGLLSNVLVQQNLIKAFQEYTRYSDVKLYLLKAIDSFLSEAQEVSEIFLQNCFLLLYSIKFPKKFNAPECAETFAYHSDSSEPFQLREKPFRKYFSSVWNSLLKYELSPEFLHKAVSALNENVLPHLQNPCLMTDFLTNCYNKGGVVSLLALKGLYILMDKYNLEYPDFFVKLYALLDKNIINGKFSSKFFELMNLFLSSTHLPAHTVAAFVKKLCRLSLLSSTDNVIKILSLVSNLLASHPSLEVLINRTSEQESLIDPFRSDVIDPAISNAIESSLWELKVYSLVQKSNTIAVVLTFLEVFYNSIIKALHTHINPDVSCKAKELTTTYPKFSTDLSKISGISMADLYRKLRKRKFEEAPLAILIEQKRLK